VSLGMVMRDLTELVVILVVLPSVAFSDVAKG
jgi:hypothetical protein